MMLKFSHALAAAFLVVTAAPALASGTAAQAPAATPAAPKYSTADTDIGTLIDNPATKAILEKHIPGMTASDQIDMARSMTLKAIQAYASDMITDERLAAIDAEFAKLK